MSAEIKQDQDGATIVCARVGDLVRPDGQVRAAQAQVVDPHLVLGLLLTDQWVWAVEDRRPTTRECIEHAERLLRLAEDELAAERLGRAWSALGALSEHLRYWERAHLYGYVALSLAVATPPPSDPNGASAHESADLLRYYDSVASRLNERLAEKRLAKLRASGWRDDPEFRIPPFPETTGEREGQ